jgi:N-acetylglucosamine-6-sulfatase
VANLGSKSSRTGIRLIVAFAISVGVLVSAANRQPAPPIGPATLPPNVILILSDDQTYDSLPSDPAAMPWLQAQIADPGGRWLWFPQAFLSSPLCCPSRATILSGGYAHHTGVQGNGDGVKFDESDTLVTRLDDAGYETALIGKYLNDYPWSRGPYIPRGWDRWVAKRNTDKGTTYESYDLIDQGVPLFVGDYPGGYATDRLGQYAVDFLRAQPSDRPYFLYFAPSAPHAPWIPALRDRGSFADVRVPEAPRRARNSIRGTPPWVRDLRPIDPRFAVQLRRWRRRESETLLSLDDVVREIVDEVRARGELDRTVIIFMTDNGWSFGEHRWVGKRCPYDPCIRTPLAIRSPWAGAATVEQLVSNVDIAPTIATLAGATAPLHDGIDLSSFILGHRTRRIRRGGILIEWAGDAEVPPWHGVRTSDFAYIETEGGWVELYDIGGAIGPPDPWELHNRADDPRYAHVRDVLAARLDAFLGAGRAHG